MAITLVQKSSTVLSPYTLSATTQHNLLVCVLTDSGHTTQQSYTLPAGWLHIPGCDALNSGNGGVNAQIWYYPDCPSGVTSVTTSPTAGLAGSAYEFAGAATSSPLDQTGTQTGSSVTSLAIVTTSTVAQTHELAVTVATGVYASATKTTISAGTGFTQQMQRNNGTKVSDHEASDTELDTGASSGVTITDTVAFSTAIDTACGSIATFAITSTAASGVAAGRPYVISQAVKTAASGY